MNSTTEAVMGVPARACAALLGAWLITGAVMAADVTTGGQLFTRKCAICHAAGGTGAIMLGRRLGQERALLAGRTDLPEAYVKAIVRAGLRSMPPLTRVELTDTQLDDVAAYLARPRPAPGSDRGSSTGAMP